MKSALSFPLLDLVAVGWFLVAWAGYTLIADGISAQYRRTLSRVMHTHRRRWMDCVMEREQRMPDVNILIAHNRSAALFCSTSILILAGVVAILGNIERIREVLSQFLFAAHSSQALIELKTVLLLLIFIYAFFKFAWSLRQFNYALILIGGAPKAGSCDEAAAADYAERAAQVLSRAGGTFNRGIRAYYFGLASLVWFVQPVAFMIATVWVLLVIYRRDYRSVTLSALSDGIDPKALPPAGGSGY
ncbi:MAG: DUF599 domain-containing protein [Rhodospirillaceae bacterium]